MVTGVQAWPKPKLYQTTRCKRDDEVSLQPTPTRNRCPCTFMNRRMEWLKKVSS